MMEVKDLLNKIFPNINDPRLIHELAEIGQVMDLPKGYVVLDEGQYIEYIPLVLDGLIKVKRKNIDDKEVYLYHLESGESCAMTLSSCLKRQKSKIVADVIEPTKLLLIPSSKIFFFMKNYTNWSEFVLETFQKKFDDAVSTVERLAFMNLEEQIMNLLLTKSDIYQSDTIKVTHNSLAQDLSTSRVIISRILKKLEKDGQVTLGHKEITIL